MSEVTLPFDEDVGEVDEGGFDASEKKQRAGTLSRILRYTVVRLVMLFITVAIGVYLTVLVANMGGYVDQIRSSAIREQIANSMFGDPAVQRMPIDERNALLEERVALAEHRIGLDQPFMVRSFRYLSNALTLDLGFAEQLHSDSGSSQVRLIILERLPSTLVLFAIAQLLLFFVAIFGALSLSRSYGSFVDKLVIALTPSSAAPGWFYGLFLILIFAAILNKLPYGGMVDAPPPDNVLEYGLSVAKHLILPVSAIVISGLFQSIYTWRTFFLIYSSEDYVDLAKAKGLPDNLIERRYILRPTLPTIITQFALTLIYLWTGAIILETVFNWPGLGRLLYSAIGQFDTPVIVASTVIFAYLLALTVFLLDFIYALVDPRVSIGDQGA